MKKIMAVFLFAVLFLAIFAMGCTGKDEGEEGSGPGYTLATKPSQVIAGGVVTFDLRLINEFDKPMKNINVQVVGVPSKYSVSGEMDSSEKIDIVQDQELPVIMTLDTVDTTIKETITPSIRVCFDYETDYFFDVAIKPRELAAEDATLNNGVSVGPISVNQIGLDAIFQESGKGTGSLSITNIWQGTIEKFNSISLDLPTTGLIKNGGLSYSKCSNTGTGLKIQGSSTGDCSILFNKLAIGDGLTAKIDVNLQGTSDVIEIERLSGKVNINYCYDIPVNTITICPAGQRC